ncbi:MAG: cytosine permease, partial [Microbacteriaceae bacterium]|nr:cytosine permease [Microbacteriaceae bacterium]
GLQFAYFPPIIEGSLSGIAGGVDLSLIVAIVSAAVLYVGALILFPEPDYVFGPKGPRIGRSVKSTIPPVR